MLKKGQKVQFSSADKIIKGIVIKGSSTFKGLATVREIGSLSEWCASACLFAISNFKISDDPANRSMKNYSVKGFKEYPEMHKDSRAYSAKIYHHNKLIILVQNNGNGGSDEFSLSRLGKKEDLKDFFEAINWWKINCKHENTFEPVNKWIEWDFFDKPYGITLKQYWDRKEEIYKKITE